MFFCCQAKEDEGLVQHFEAKEDGAEEFFPAVSTESAVTEVKQPEHNDNSDYAFKQQLGKLDSILFDPSSVDLTLVAKDLADKYVKVLKEFPEKAIKIVGFSTEVLSTPGHNLQLARDRCRAIRSFFQARMCTNGIAIQGKGNVDGRSNQVIVEPCDPATLGLLESTATSEDAAFAEVQQKIQAQTEAKVNREVVHEQPPPESKRCVEQAPQETPKPKVEVTLEFLSRDGSRVKLQLVRRPIGLTFDLLATQLSVKSVKPLSAAEDAGVKMNMVLASVDGEPLADKNSNYVWEKVKLAVGKLPAS